MALTKIDDRGLKTPIDLLDNEKIRFGTGNDLEIYHDGSHSFIKDAGTGNLRLGAADLRIQTEDFAENYILGTKNGSVDLYYDNSKKFETISGGATVTGSLGVNNSSPLYPLHFKNAMSSSPYWIHMEVTGTNATGGGAGIAFDTSATNSTSNNGLFLATISGERSASANGSNTLVFKTSKANVAGDGSLDSGPKTQMVITEDGVVRVPDSNKFTAGDGDDLQIYHDASNSRIHNSTGALIHRTPSYYHWYNSDGTETLAQFVVNGACKLYYDNSKKFETTSGGVTTSGTHRVNGPSSSSYNLEVYPAVTTPYGIHVKEPSGTISAGYPLLNITDNSGVGHFRVDSADTGTVSLPKDNKKLTFGAGADLQIYHDGTYNYIDSVNNHQTILKAGTTHLFLQGNPVWLTDEGNSHTYFKGSSGGAAELYHDNNLKFKTTSDGVVVTGGIYLDGSGGGNAANKIDDYEEGTFTPTVHDGSGNSYSIIIDNAKYTKIGRQVTIDYQIKNNESGTTSGILTMRSLPFAPNYSLQSGSFWVDHGSPTAGLGDIIGGLHSVGTANGGTVYWAKPTDESGVGTSSTRYVEHGQWSEGRWIYGQFIYHT